MAVYISYAIVLQHLFSLSALLPGHLRHLRVVLIVQLTIVEDEHDIVCQLLNAAILGGL